MIRRVAAVALLSSALAFGGTVAVLSLLAATLLLPTRSRLATGTVSGGW